MKKPLPLLICPCYILTLTLFPLSVDAHGGHHAENNAANETGCGISWGCFHHHTCSESGDVSACPFFFKWRLEDDLIHFKLQSITDGYVALGISTSGKMSDSEVYSCSIKASKPGVLRGWNQGHEYLKKDIIANSLSHEKVTVTDGRIICEFKRAMYLEGNDDKEFLDLRPNNTYTVLTAWFNKTDDEGFPEFHEKNYARSKQKIDFTEYTSSSTGSESEFLPKLHGILMTLAWMGFATVGVTSSRYYKPIWPETTLWGKPVWFSIHRTSMVTALSCTIVAAVVIVIHVQGYLLPSGGTIRFLHALFGTIVTVLAICNFVMALFRPHPGTPNRPIYNWAHWSVGTLALYLALATILLGVAPFDESDELLGGIPDVVFWVAAFFVVFHLIIWMSLHYISITIESTGRDNDVPLVNEVDESEKAPINGSIATSASSQMKQLLFWVYITGVIIAVLVVVIGIIIAKE